MTACRTISSITGGGTAAVTVMVTGADLVAAPRVSIATAVSVRGPNAAVDQVV